MGRAAMFGFCAVVVIYFVGPVLLLLQSSFSGGLYLEFPPPSFSFKWYKEFFQDSGWTKALLSSAGIALVVALIDVILAGMAAYWLERTDSPAERTISTLLLVPAMMPVVIYTLAVYGTFARWEFLGSWTQLIIAHSVLGYPYALLIIRAGVSGLDPDLEDAARTLGAGPLRVALFIAIPLMRWHLAFAAFGAFVVSFTEPVTAIFLTSGETVTLPKKTWEGLRYGIDPRTVVGTTIMLYLLLLGLAMVTVKKSISRSSRLLTGE
jgi:ABC-type spermidine/putrescine transport system permease subunit II